MIRAQTFVDEAAAPSYIYHLQQIPSVNRSYHQFIEFKINAEINHAGELSARINFLNQQKFLVIMQFLFLEDQGMAGGGRDSRTPSSAHGRL